MAGETGDGGCEADWGIDDAGLRTLTRAAARRSKKSESNEVSLGVLDTIAASPAEFASLRLEPEIWELGNDGIDIELRCPGDKLCRRL